MLGKYPPNKFSFQIFFYQMKKNYFNIFKKMLPPQNKITKISTNYLFKDFSKVDNK